MKLGRAHFLALAAAAVLAASALPWPAFLAGAELCPFHALTGLPCPGCGLTRAFRAIAHGEFAAAWGFNPFGFPLFALVFVCAFAPLWRTRAPRAKTQALLALLLVGSMLVYGAVRAADVLARAG